MPHFRGIFDSRHLNCVFAALGTPPRKRVSCIAWTFHCLGRHFGMDIHHVDPGLVGHEWNPVIKTGFNVDAIASDCETKIVMKLKLA